MINFLGLQSFIMMICKVSYEHLKGGGKGGCWNGGKGELGGFCSLVNEMPWWVWGCINCAETGQKKFINLL